MPHPYRSVNDLSANTCTTACPLPTHCQRHALSQRTAKHMPSPYALPNTCPSPYTPLNQGPRLTPLPTYCRARDRGTYHPEGHGGGCTRTTRDSGAPSIPRSCHPEPAAAMGVRAEVAGRRATPRPVPPQSVPALCSNAGRGGRGGLCLSAFPVLHC